MRGVVVSMLLGLAACGGDGQAELGPEDDFKGCPPELPVFAPGLQALGAEHTLTLVSAEPAEPERYENDWVVELSPEGAELVRGQTFMPVHGHDGRVEPELMPLSQPGQFAIERLNFTMRGPWEVRLWTRTDATEDYVVFQVCVAK
jgi:hypothetical protein